MERHLQEFGEWTFWISPHAWRRTGIAIHRGMTRHVVKHCADPSPRITRIRINTPSGQLQMTCAHVPHTGHGEIARQ
eukprot:6455621-Amphidinium_carterae.1